MLDLDAIRAGYRFRCVTCDGTGCWGPGGGDCVCCSGRGWQQGNMPNIVRDLIAEVERLRGQRQTPGATASQEPPAQPFTVMERTAALQDDGSRIPRAVWHGDYPTQEAAMRAITKRLHYDSLGLFEVVRNGVIVRTVSLQSEPPPQGGPPYAIVVHLQDGSEPPSGSYRTLADAIREAKALYHGPLGQSAMYEIVDSNGVIVHVVSWRSEEQP